MSLIYNPLLKECLQEVGGSTPEPSNNIIVVDAQTINNDMSNIDAAINTIVILTNILTSQTISFTTAAGIRKTLKGSNEYDIPFRSAGAGKFQLLLVPILN